MSDAIEPVDQSSRREDEGEPDAATGRSTPGRAQPGVRALSPTVLAWSLGYCRPQAVVSVAGIRRIRARRGGCRDAGALAVNRACGARSAVLWPAGLRRPVALRAGTWFPVGYEQVELRHAPGRPDPAPKRRRRNDPSRGRLDLDVRNNRSSSRATCIPARQVFDLKRFHAWCPTASLCKFCLRQNRAHRR